MFGNGIALQGLVFAPTLLRREGAADPMELMLKAKSDGRIVRTLRCSVFVLITPPDAHPAGVRQVSALVTHLEISADTTVRVAARPFDESWIRSVGAHEHSVVVPTRRHSQLRCLAKPRRLRWRLSKENLGRRPHNHSRYVDFVLFLPSILVRYCHSSSLTMTRALQLDDDDVESTLAVRVCLRSRIESRV
eukprot:COSAG01_NODE_828_length_13273_cov_231.615484_3_plen_191_part_00